MEVLSENLKDLLEDFFKLHKSSTNEEFLKYFMIMLNEEDIEVILEALERKSNLSFNNEKIDFENDDESKIVAENLVNKILCMENNERSIFIKFMINEMNEEETDFILHMVDGRQQYLNEKEIMGDKENKMYLGIEGQVEIKTEVKIPFNNSFDEIKTEENVIHVFFYPDWP